MEILTIPSEDEIKEIYSTIPEKMFPSKRPTAVVLKGALLPDECDAILNAFEGVEAYNFPECHSTATLEYPQTILSQTPPFSPVNRLAEAVNDSIFQFELAARRKAWLQVYDDGAYYNRHEDGSIGQSRKLTAVVLLSDPENYDGGNLVVEINNGWTEKAPRDRGTIVIFPSWVTHWVSPITKGRRHSLNLGFWGPPFR